MGVTISTFLIACCVCLAKCSQRQNRIAYPTTVAYVDSNGVILYPVENTSQTNPTANQTVYNSHINANPPTYDQFIKNQNIKY